MFEIGVLIALIVSCFAVACALLMLNDKVNKEVRRRTVRFVQNFNDLMESYQETDDKLLAYGQRRLEELRDEMNEILEDGFELYDGYVDRVLIVRDRVTKLLQRF